MRNSLGWLDMLDGVCLAGGNTGPVAGDYHIQAVTTAARDLAHPPPPFMDLRPVEFELLPLSMEMHWKEAHGPVTGNLQQQELSSP